MREESGEGERGGDGAGAGDTIDLGLGIVEEVDEDGSGIADSGGAGIGKEGVVAACLNLVGEGLDFVGTSVLVENEHFFFDI